MALRMAVCAAAAGALTACATAPAPRPLASRGERVRAYNAPYVVRGRRYTPLDQPRYDEVGTASWYGFESGRRTSDGETFTLEGLSAAHRTLPIPSLLEVTNLENGRRVTVRLNDRGPFVSGRLLDVSRAAARELGFLGRGTARVRVRYLGPAGPWPGAWPTREIARADPAARSKPSAPPPAPRPAPELEAVALVADLPD